MAVVHTCTVEKDGSDCPEFSMHYKAVARIFMEGVLLKFHCQSGPFLNKDK